MRTTIVFTLTGPDRVGLVEEVTDLILGIGGNIETSRMARLGGEFAILMLVTLPAEERAHLDATVAHLDELGFRVTVSQTRPATVEAAPGWVPYRIQVSGADHEGIIHNIAAGLSRQGINIEAMDTGTSRAPVTGTQLFSMSALVMVPAELAHGAQGGRGPLERGRPCHTGHGRVGQAPSWEGASHNRRRPR
jgi:glycine cleavage system transcriptional repressor